MRKLTLLLILLLMSSLSLLIPVGCDKLTTETNNNTYYDSTLGQDCLRCHSDADNKIAQPQGQWATSAHASPELIEAKVTYNGTDYETNACGPQCHTNEGFIKYAGNATIATVQAPSVINCFTCHLPHTGNYGSWKVDTLRGLVSPVTLNGTNITYDAGKSNQCVVCHQATKIPTIPAGTLTIKLDSLGIDGPHNSTQAHDFIGQGGFRFTTTAVTNSHANLIDATQGGCLACHFGTGQGYSYGEHTFRLQSSDGSQQYLANCSAPTCHPAMTSFSSTGGTSNRPAYIHAALDSLAGILVAGHVLTGADRDSTEFFKDSSVSADAARILFNYLLVKKDGSGGAHNAKYDSTLLDESIRQWDSLPHASFTASADTACSPIIVTFTDASTGRITKRKWHFGTVDSSETQNPTYNFTIPGTYPVLLTVSNEGGVSSFLDTIEIQDPGLLTLSKSNDTAEAGTVIWLRTNSLYGGTTIWEFGDGTPTVKLPDSASHAYNPAAAQWFYVSVTRQTVCDTTTVADSIYITLPPGPAPRRLSARR